MKREQSEDETGGDVNRSSRHLLANTDRILEWSEGGLTPDERASLEEHFRSCGECAEYASRATALEASLQEALQRPALSQEFSSRLKQKIESEYEVAGDPGTLYRLEKSRMEAEFARFSEGLRRQCFRPSQLLDLLSYAMVLGLAGYILLFAWSSQQARIQEFLVELPRRHDWLALTTIGVIFSVGTLLLTVRGRISRWIQI